MVGKVVGSSLLFFAESCKHFQCKVFGPGLVCLCTLLSATGRFSVIEWLK